MSELIVADIQDQSKKEIAEVLRSMECKAVFVPSFDALVDSIARPSVAGVILDTSFDNDSALTQYGRINEIDPHLPVIVTTSSSNSRLAIEATKLGALDYLIKPIDGHELRRAVNRALEIRRLASEPVSLNPHSLDHEEGDALIGRCLALQDVYKSIGRVASQSVAVLIRGASGTGKELVARAIFQFGNRSDKPFMAINCAAIPDALLESELFGHEKGAFTGAEKQRIGKFEQCDGGTLFLDEIGDMSTVLQSKLLRILQEQTFERVGGGTSIKTNVRVISATHRNLEEMVENGSFRGDLYYRLNGYTITLPPLCKRGGDLAFLIEHFRINANQELGKSVKRFSEGATRRLHEYKWPGNVRELQSVIRSSILHSSGDVVIEDFLPPLGPTEGVDENEPESGLSLNKQIKKLSKAKFESGENDILDSVVHRVERMLVTEVLELTRGNQVEAAERLGITRTTLRSKIAKYGILINRVVN